MLPHNNHPFVTFVRTLRRNIVQHTKETFEFFGPTMPVKQPVSTTPTIIRVPFDARRRLKKRYCQAHHSRKEQKCMMNFVHEQMRKNMSHSHMHSRPDGFSFKSFKKFREIRRANIRACEQAMLQYKMLVKKSQPLLIKRLSMFPVVVQHCHATAASQFARSLFRQSPSLLSKGFVGRNVLDTHLQRGLGLGGRLGRQPLLASLFSNRSVISTRFFSSSTISAASVKTAVFASASQSDNVDTSTAHTTVPRTGSYVHFDIEPKFSISQETNLSEDVVETLSNELNDYADRLKRLADDLQNLASMGHLPVSLEQGKALKVFFANCEPERLDQILTGAEVTEGTIRCQVSPHNGAHLDISDESLFDFETSQSSLDLSYSMSRSWLSTASSHDFVLERLPVRDGMSEAESGLPSTMPSMTDASSGETVSEVLSAQYA